MKRILAGILSASIITASLPMAIGADTPSPADIKGHWAENAITLAIEHDWISAAENFDPDAGMTRGEFFLALARLDGAPQGGNTLFSDVGPAEACAPYMDWGVEWHLISGTGAGTFEPAATITREDAAVLLHRYLSYRQIDLTQNQEVESFSDINSIASYAQKPVNVLWSAGLFTGTESRCFDPKASLTRAEAAVLLERCMLLSSKKHSELLSIPSFDGYPLQGKLDLPDGQTIDKIVVFVNGSGPNTYDNRRDMGGKVSNYFDIFADHFTEDGVAFFRSNTRGVTLGTEPPLFQQINEEEYQTYLPENTVRDTEEIIKALKKDERLKDAEVYLLGWSEGTMIAPKVAARGNVPVDGLLLGGYCNDTMEEIWNWQQSGESSMIFYREYFDYDGDGHVSRAEFEEDRYQIREILGASFDQLDLNLNGEIDADDIAQLQAPFRAQMLKAVEDRDDAWLKENYSVQLTSGWFQAHRDFQPNREMLTDLTIPIHIFHGTNDLNVSVQGVYDIESAFKKLGKTNLTTHIYEGADHDLNITIYMAGGDFPQGFLDLFRVVKES